MRGRHPCLFLSAILVATLGAACGSGSSQQGVGPPGLNVGVNLAAPPGASGVPVVPSELAAVARPLVFVSNRDAYFEIYTMLSDGTGQRALTKTADLNSWPALSPDGSRIAFARTVRGNTDVYVMNARGSGLRQLTTARAPDYHPTWSRDGNRIAFESMRDGDAEIYVMDADGSHQVDVTNDPGLDGSPAWSPDGSWISFESTRNGRDELYAIHPDGSALRRLTDSRGENTDPAWSPDGRTIAFSSTRFGQPRLFVMDPDGAAQIMVSPPPSGLGPGVAHGLWADSNPAWSPDGAWLAFQTTRSGTPQVWAMRLDGESAVALTESGANGSPSWGG